MADLHAHTTASDGDSTPSQLVVLARNAKLRAVAVTDHDTVAGVAEALATARSLGESAIDVVPGIELSVSYREREVHVLGLFIDPEHADLKQACLELTLARKQRFQGYLDALRKRNYTIPSHLVSRFEMTAASLGRRHMASLLVESRIVASRHAAFSRVLPEG
ncbi:MAG: PHP domain-containing protein [Gemmataceae bacterium]